MDLHSGRLRRDPPGTNTLAYYEQLKITAVRGFVTLDSGPRNVVTLNDSFEFTKCGLYYKYVTIMNADSRVVRMTFQVVASPTIIIVMTIEVSYVLLENINSTGVTPDNRKIFIAPATLVYSET